MWLKTAIDITLPTIEYKYINLKECVKEVLQFDVLLLELKLLNGKIIVFIDNQGAYHINRNLAYHDSTKLIGLKYQFTRHEALNEFVQVEKIQIDKNLTDMRPKLQRLGNYYIVGDSFALTRPIRNYIR